MSEDVPPRIEGVGDMIRLRLNRVTHMDPTVYVLQLYIRVVLYKFVVLAAQYYSYLPSGAFGNSARTRPRDRDVSASAEFIDDLPHRR